MISLLKVSWVYISGDVLLRASHIFKQTKLFHVLEAAGLQAGPNVLLELYLDDLVRMVYRAQSRQPDMEYEVCPSLIRKTRKIRDKFLCIHHTCQVSCISRETRALSPTLAQALCILTQTCETKLLNKLQFLFNH